jgi:putative MATE family efflux protein
MEQTEGIKTLLGDPKKAIIKLSIPMIIAMSVHTIYNLVDALWVSGLGADALAAVGFVYPLFFMALALATGLGVGAGSALSRNIGAKDKDGADAVTSHAFVLMFITVIIFTIPLFFFAESIFEMIGAGPVVGPLATIYGQIIFAGSIFMFLNYIINAILRGEGDAKRAMYAMVFGAILNIILDPIFIYSFGLGVAGAAYATVLSFSLSSIIMLYWLVIKKDTFVTLNLKKFSFNRKIVVDIFQVGIPAALMQLSMAITMLVINGIIVFVSTTNGVAIYTTGWRVSMIAILPTIGIATAIVSVSGAAYGAKSYEKLNISHLYAVKLGLIMEIIISVVTFIFAPQIAYIFTQAESAITLREGLTIFLQISALWYPGIAFGMLSSSLFQGVGKGVNALIITVLRTLVLTPVFAILFATTLGLGLTGIWWGIVAANTLFPIIAFSWARLFIRGLNDNHKKIVKNAIPVDTYDDK